MNVESFAFYLHFALNYKYLYAFIPYHYHIQTFFFFLLKSDTFLIHFRLTCFASVCWHPLSIQCKFLVSFLQLNLDTPVAHRISTAQAPESTSNLHLPHIASPLTCITETVSHSLGDMSNRSPSKQVRAFFAP